MNNDAGKKLFILATFIEHNLDRFNMNRVPKNAGDENYTVYYI